MKIKKSDWTMVREAEKNGLMVGMTGLVERKRTILNEELNSYFRSQFPDYQGSFDEYEGEDILYSINEYLAERNIVKNPLDFPLTSGTDIHLIPINKNIHLKLIVSDECNGGWDYSKYVMADFFMINNDTTKEDVDELIGFIHEYILSAI